MNNYNALGAIVAGISGNAVYRLIQTRELVSPKAQKDFMRLEILMGTHKGHFAYRLAWRNSPTPRIPFLPLHRRDLVSADEGNRTFFDAPTPAAAAPLLAPPTSPTSPTTTTAAAAAGVPAAAAGGVAIAAGRGAATAAGWVPGAAGVPVTAVRPRINWKKFEIMGEVIVSLHQSQAAPYPDLERKLDVQRLVLDCEVVKDEDVRLFLFFVLSKPFLFPVPPGNLLFFLVLKPPLKPLFPSFLAPFLSILLICRISAPSLPFASPLLLLSPYFFFHQNVDLLLIALFFSLCFSDNSSQVLYDRSAELENPVAGASAGETSMRRKFSWFQR
jgi:hypothetical protein